MQRSHFVVSIIGNGDLRDLMLVDNLRTAFRLSNELFNIHKKDYSENGYLKITHFAFMGEGGVNIFTVNLNEVIEDINREITKFFGEENNWN
ncbi:hypothetical protein [Priestia aryabhattai]